MLFHLNGLAGLTGERQEEKPEHVKGSEARGNEADKPKQFAAVRTREGFPKDFILTEESRKERRATDGQRSDEHGFRGSGNSVPKPSHLAHILRAAQSVNHAPRSQEEQSLEEGMRHQMEDSCAERPHTTRQKHVPELADRRVGQ